MPSREVHVRFTGPFDPDSAVAVLTAHGLSAAAKGEESAIEIGCQPGDEESVLCETSHAVEEWLLSRGLPFVPVRTARTLIVRPPAD